MKDKSKVIYTDETKEELIKSLEEDDINLISTKDNSVIRIDQELRVLMVNHFKYSTGGNQ